MGIKTKAGRLPRKLEDFIGVWEMWRVTQPAIGEAVHFVGQCEWRATEHGALCIEKGVMTVPGNGTLNSEQRFHWGHDLAVTFEDGRPFHTVPPTGGPVSHWCDPDAYEGWYDFSEWPEFGVAWDAKGPRKDYRMETVYTRSSA